ncbi:putative arylalkylamine n-acetyltransferase [Streptococcus sp. DD10]|uniref:GNAT family N-acetyltransferase n=1 Tax=Streptococcus sp. DD10 TaxID=1777878 RepID=UPI00079552DA|nr:putative arylalkylamine n-acetyltransferase [Streptococcus sp. DD10]
MESPIKIRNVQLSDWEELVRLENLNFSEEEAASPAALKERIEWIADTFLVADFHGQIAGYIVGPAIFSRHLTDDLFAKVTVNPKEGGFIAIQSLSVSPDFQGQGVGTLLLAALKERASEQNRQGINLTCHDNLLSYYEMNGFRDEGISDSVHGGTTWFDMVWENPYYKE